jgi:hypothetical protein
MMDRREFTSFLTLALLAAPLAAEAQPAASVRTAGLFRESARFRRKR